MMCALLSLIFLIPFFKGLLFSDHFAEQEYECIFAGYRSRLKQLPGSAACCIRKDRRRIPSKVKANLHLFTQEDLIKIH